MIVDSYLSYQ